MCGYRWFSNTRKYRSSLTSTDEGWTIAGSNGSIATSPAATAFLMSPSESSTAAGYADQYSVLSTQYSMHRRWVERSINPLAVAATAFLMSRAESNASRPLHPAY